MQPSCGMQPSSSMPPQTTQELARWVRVDGMALSPAGTNGRLLRRRDDVTHKGEKIDWGAWAITGDDPEFRGTGNPDTGDDYGPAPGARHPACGLVAEHWASQQHVHGARRTCMRAPARLQRMSCTCCW